VHVLRTTVLAVVTALVTTLAPMSGASSALMVPDVATVNGNAVKYVEQEGHYATAYAIRGETLHFTVDYTGKTLGTYETQVSCVDQENQYAQTVVTDEPAVGVVEYTATTPDTPYACSIRVRKIAPSGIEYDRYLRVELVQPSAEIYGFQNPSGSAFYPLVADHPDSWTANFQTTHPARATVIIRTLSGKIVYTANKWPKAGPSPANSGWKFGFAWSGRNSSTGNLVAKGTYKVGFLVRSTLNDTSDTYGPVNAIVTPGRRTITKSIVLEGRAARTTTGGGCLTSGPSVSSLWLECSQATGSSYAQAVWTFWIPAAAKIAGWKLTGAKTAGDDPTSGTITHKLSRPSSTKVQITTRLTGRRAFIIYSVKLTYSYLQ